MLVVIQYALLLLAVPTLISAKPRLLPFKPFTDTRLPPYVCNASTHDVADDGAARADFLVVGAGMSGLAAAHYLYAHTEACTIRVLEARSVPGGRVRTTTDGPFTNMEIGAGWIHEYMGNPMLAVAHAMRIRTKWVGGDSSYVGGEEKIQIYDDRTVLDKKARERSFDLMDSLLDRIYEEIDDRIDDHMPDSSLLSTIHNLTSTLSSADKRLLRWHLDVIFGGDWAAPLKNLSMMALEPGPLAYEGGDCVFPKGFMQVPQALAQGVDVAYEEPATNISWRDDEIRVVSERGNVWQANKMLMTASIGVQRSSLINFHPPLPSYKQRTLDKFGMASLNRIMLRFPHAFWVNGTYTFGFLPSWISDDDQEDAWATEPVFSVAVVAAYEDREVVGGGAVLTFMIGGDSGSQILSHSDASIVSRVMRLLRRTFGSSIPDPTAYAISDWASEPFALGVYAYLPVNTSVHIDVPALIQPLSDKNGVERLFWAGEATMKGSSRGTTHGAFLSGIREAARMIGRDEIVEKVVKADEEDFLSANKARSFGRQAMTARSSKRGIVVDDWFGAGEDSFRSEKILCGEYKTEDLQFVVQRD
ncbi:hypothetical protein PUNSTDRAFT_52155 [Punctularia strigosozonata HHB-11173 SS5]|uniref:uncharacterized protein n=1 Tax=Punctularia strigosozonata (strain HHB-11173) TaxID=741275 RepID=UPI0004416B2A|nr:uncharacterized protein PUNSTDRAFT_52155 [Punctularia strigosozonata HHB-11173 SS5]EIN10068.1 hypothetical protein PUNSTDRAFT_52155 [Punctularia strigosozonata HHB-11173 SS5]